MQAQAEVDATDNDDFAESILEVLRMKHDNHTGRPAMAIKTMIAGVALSALLGFSINAQAQTCTIANWDSATGLAVGDTGLPGSNNRRYAGPCGLRVDLDGTPRYLTDNSPATETTYIARFYTFLNNAGTDPVILFADDADNVQVWYNVPNAGDISLQVFDSADQAHLASFLNVGPGWHSIEFEWESAASANIGFSVNGADDQTLSIDTSGISLSSVKLGNIDGATGGTVDFDDFDSRRISRPGRLCRGLTDPDRAPAGDGWQRLQSVDRQNIFVEIATGGNIPAGGQPDFNEDGSVGSADRQGIFVAIATGQNSCEVLR